MDVTLCVHDIETSFRFAIDVEFRIKRYRTHPQHHPVNLDNGRREALPEDDDGYSSALAILHWLYSW